MRAQIRGPRGTGAVLALGAVLLAPSPSRADNPIVQTLYTADPAPMVHDGTLYLYTTHDEDVTVNDFFTMNDWRVYSTTDAVNWTDHGSPLHYDDFSWARGDAWAGQAVERDGTFYFYVPMTHNAGNRVIGVATSDSPFGPFEDALGEPLVTSDCGDIDPTVFIDDDGQAYLYWGNPDLCYVRLNEDMVTYQGDVVHIPMTTASFGVRANTERATSYEEGPWLYKREGLYYMVFAAGPISEHIGYATSASATGPWAYGGVVMPTQGGSFTNHPGVIDYKGKSLFFYHNAALPGGGGFRRSVSVEEISYGADGSISQVDMTSEGPEAVDTLNPFALTEAETISWQAGIETEVCSEGGMNVTSIEDGDYIKIREVEFGSGATSVEIRVAAASGGGALELRLGSSDGDLIADCVIEATGGDQTWATQSCDVSGATGNHDLFLGFTGGGFKLDWWKFAGPGDPGETTTGGAGGQASGGGGGSGAAGTGPVLGTGGVAGAAGTLAGPATSGGGPVSSGGAPNGGGFGMIAGTAGTVSETLGAAGASLVTGTINAGGGGGATAGTQSATGSAGVGVPPAVMLANAPPASGAGGCHVSGSRSSSGPLSALALLGWVALRSLRRRPAAGES